MSSSQLRISLSVLIGMLIMGTTHPPLASASAPTPKPCESYIWRPNMVQIGADIACKGPVGEGLGFDGSGVVVGSIDSGVDITSANSNLLTNYQCYGLADQSACWFDPSMTHSATPIDDFTHEGYLKHGTAAMSVAVGQSGWGVAPGAKWIACKGYQATDLSKEMHDIGAIKQCLDWYIQRRPDIVFSSIPLTADMMDQEITDKLNTLVSLNVVVVVSTGNRTRPPNAQAPACDSLTIPALNPNVISVGNVYRQGDINVDSIHPTSGCGGLGTSLSKPDLVAPGTLITSPINPTWEGWIGTSMSTPHVAGVAALMLSAKPTLTPAQIKAILQGTAKHISDSYCGSNPSTPNANPIYGWGRVQAVPAVMSLTAPTSGISAAFFNCAGGYGVIKGGRYWYRANSNSIWYTNTLTSTYGVPIDANSTPTTNLDSAYINRATGTEVVIKGDSVWSRPLPCGGTPGSWSKSSLYAAYYPGTNADSLTYKVPTTSIDAAYADNSGNFTVIKGDRYWYRAAGSASWYTNTLSSAYYPGTNADSLIYKVPTANIDTAYIDTSGGYTVVKGDRYWYRAAGSASWYTNTLDSAYYGQPFNP